MMILDQVQRSGTMLELPPLSLYSMTKPQLEEFIPRLINLSGSSSPPSLSPIESPSVVKCESFYKPEWWPVDVPWSAPQPDDQQELCKKFTGRETESTDTLRSVVEACYEYMGHKDLLNQHNTEIEANMAVNMDCLKDNVEVVAVESSEDESEMEVVDVYVCFYCDHWFGGKDGKTKLEEHVLTHMNSAQELASSRESSQSPIVYSNEPSPALREASLFLPQCHSDLVAGSPAISSRESSQSPVPPPQVVSRTSSVRTSNKVPQRKSSRLKPSWALRSKALIPKVRKRPPEIPLEKRPDLPSNLGVGENEFLKSFGLITSKQAKTVAAKPTVEMDIDCEIVAVEGLESRPLNSPRTPKSIMSQLSREGEGSSRKRLSFARQDDGSDGETPEASPNKNIQGALLNVAISSLLGKRVKKHIKPEGNLNINKNPEEFCSTVYRNEFLDKLRYRASDYPVTYKKKRKHLSKHTHEYKFNRQQKRDFMKRIKTGLNKESRRLKRQMMDLRVVIKRLSQEEIDFWKQKRKCHGAEWIDDDISIVEVEPAPMSVQVERARMHRAHGAGPSGVIRSVPRSMPQRPMQTQRTSSLQTKAPYLMQQLTSSQPAAYAPKNVPQFLVKKVEKQFNGHQSSKLVYVPISEMQAEPHKRIQPRWNPNQQSSQQNPGSKSWGPNTMVADRRKLSGPLSASRRKQHFGNVRKEMDCDSDVSIRSEDSEEEIQERKASRAASAVLSQSRKPIPPMQNNHMVMSATGECVKTVGQKARKSFSQSRNKVSAQMIKHFNSHPVSSSSPPGPYSKSPQAGTGVGLKAPVRQSVSPIKRPGSSPGVSHSKTTVKAQYRPTMVPPKPALNIVDDVIYIDDD